MNLEDSDHITLDDLKAVDWEEWREAVLGPLREELEQQAAENKAET